MSRKVGIILSSIHCLAPYSMCSQRRVSRDELLRWIVRVRNDNYSKYPVMQNHVYSNYYRHIGRECSHNTELHER